MSKKSKDSASEAPKPGKTKAARRTRPDSGSATKRKFCLFTRCRAEPKTDGYCRLHYIAVWKTMQLNKRIKAEKKLNSYVDRLVKKYPKDYMDKLKEGLENDEKFQKTLDEVGEVDFSSEGVESTTEKEFLEKLARDLKVKE